MGKIRISTFFILIGIFSCEENIQTLVKSSIDEVKQNHAPDSRVAVFQIDMNGSSPVILTGETNLPEAKAELLSSLAKQQVKVEDQIVLLPDQSVGDEKYALINVSVANLRSKPRHSAELVTQALLGTPVNVLKIENSWCLVQTPDLYIAWTNEESLVRMNDQELRDWKSKPKIIYTDTYGFSYGKEGKGGRISDLVAGNVFNLIKENNTNWHVQYPDGRQALIIRSSAAKYASWREQINPSDSSLIRASRRLMGVPYLWGGTSTKGLDCSGFTKTVYFLHGYIIPRDASQQVHEGKLVDTERDFSKLEVGDLLFFGKKNEDNSEKVVHVGLWIGNNQFIHAATDVHISSMDSTASNFDDYNYSRYLRSKRILGHGEELKKMLINNYGS